MRIARQGVTVISFLLAGCALLRPLPGETSRDDRLGAFPTADLPLERPVSIHWNAYQVPFVEAETDHDAAFALGLVHAHLRLGQMEVMRRISRGRLAEMGGPIAADIDHALRILDLGKAAPAVLAAMPADSRAWLDAFVAGVNHYQAGVAKLPHEFGLLGLDRAPWSAADVLTVGRLASVDVNWIIWSRLLRMRRQPDWPELWAKLLAEGTASIPSYGPKAPWATAALEEIFTGFSRAGSNSMAVAGSRTRSGSALIASDPHLGVSLPNLWLLAGYKSPSYHVVGLMIPGTPFVAVGRNPRIAWGGTNLRAASSDLFDATGFAADQIGERTERIGIRWWPDRDVTVRETPFGPLISDAPFLGAGENGTFALRWIGHTPTDEMTAMLGVNRAQNWAAFREALRGFAVSGQNMVYADVDGHIGQVMATHLPARSLEPPPDVVLPVEFAAAWDTILTGLDLPAAFDPPEGFVASANNRGAEASVPIGYFFSSNDRILRLSQVLRNGGAPIEFDDLATLQRDVYMLSAVKLRDVLVEEIARLAADQALSDDQAQVFASLRDWDGHFRADSAGAVAFQQIVHHYAQAHLSAERLSAYSTAGRLFNFLETDLRVDGDGAAAALSAALSKAAEGLVRFPTWGEMHRLRLAHLLGVVPVVGGRYRFGDVPVGGSSSTVMKTAHSLTGDRHNTQFGSQARHISDMSDLDANYFVLLGGQDGWFNSANFLDQFELWREGRYIQLPLRPDTVRETFDRHMELRPAG